ncbi:hypothetical protein EZV62_004085 [Acer yangbiense]|uniref:USP domain-containing protein n=1 Tax=Acer yangbiense TaxID=1000413 RepID=A0A5C7IIP2_9ROSI|nr:hypothetical protein EZV62_004085 [Acer yangbiense]
MCWYGGDDSVMNSGSRFGDVGGSSGFGGVDEDEWLNNMGSKFGDDGGSARIVEIKEHGCCEFIDKPANGTQLFSEQFIWKKSKMMTKREYDDGSLNEEGYSKRLRVAQLGFENPLLPLANTYDDEEDNGRKEQYGGQVKRSRLVQVRKDCPYLDTVNRQVLDFDFRKLCSVSLSDFNVYACLVCGKYYQGRGQKSHAYTHSLEAGHHIYINLQTEKVYCLPDGYEINDPSLDDIRHVLNPRFTKEQVEQIDKNKLWSRALDSSDYLLGMVGLNNIMETDFVNVKIQSLMRVDLFRNFFLICENYRHCKSPLVHRFGELTQKIWHARNFKGQLSPHEFLQAVIGRFQIGPQSKPFEFMSWLLNTLHKDLRTSKKNTSIIYECFQGELEVVKEIPNKTVMKEDEDDQNVTDFTAAVNFLVKNLELKDYIPLPTPEAGNERLRSKYDLIANIIHDGKPDKGFYRVFVQRKSEELWYEIQDLHVSETLPQMVALSEAYMQIYERQQ